MTADVVFHFNHILERAHCEELFTEGRGNAQPDIYLAATTRRQIYHEGGLFFRKKHHSPEIRSMLSAGKRMGGFSIGRGGDKQLTI